ncbi:hypothetical protein [Streptomyces prasinus]|uniref:hypothetical protein n=1 Tax=Streptomyces prasinus TaxID=67345 RepID=UPI0033BB2334
MIAVNILPSSAQTRIEDWNPAAAIGLTCTDCHPERRDAAPEARPDDEDGTVRREAHDDGADESFTEPDSSGTSATA